jgi:hypothetical protein
MDRVRGPGRCRKVLNSFGNIDSFQTTVDRRPFEGVSLRLFNPKTRLWSIYWANGEAVVLDVPQVGSFENKIVTMCHTHNLNP